MTRATQNLCASIVLASLLLSAPAHAGGGGGGGGGGSKGPGNRIEAGFSLEDPDGQGGDGEEHVPQSGPRAVILPTIAVPTFQDGFLLNYMFISVQVTVEPGVDPWKVRAHSADMRDAIIREAHRRSIGAPDAPGSLDDEVAAAVLHDAVTSIVEADSVEQIDVITADLKLGSG